MNKIGIPKSFDRPVVSRVTLTAPVQEKREYPHSSSSHFRHLSRYRFRKYEETGGVTKKGEVEGTLIPIFKNTTDEYKEKVIKDK